MDACYDFFFIKTGLYIAIGYLETAAVVREEECPLLVRALT
jgi:hypothetical protein